MSHCNEIEYDDVEPIVVNTFITGHTVSIRICRHSDGFYLDWSDDTFKTAGSVVTMSQPLMEKDATNAPGIYVLSSVSHPDGLDTSSLSTLNPAVDETLIVMATATAPPRNIVPSTLKLKCLVDGVVDRKTVLSRMNAMARGKVTLSGAAVKPSQVATYYEEDDATVSYATDNKGNVRDPVP
jgi:hypothetical protein